MIAKIFLFQFVNSYSSFFYLAFLAERVGDCPDLDQGGCMPALTSNLGKNMITLMFCMMPI
ncbi:hypothetical protein EON65_20075 [archaeon]|nr:MAG: hypothetical protein EON65_20075 [archaeon]